MAPHVGIDRDYPGRSFEGVVGSFVGLSVGSLVGVGGWKGAERGAIPRGITCDGVVAVRARREGCGLCPVAVGGS
ncbi:hypothetical protein Tco_1547482 [Tanacetum coccineum]